MSNQKPTAIVVLACGFETKPRIQGIMCRQTEARLDYALDVANNLSPDIDTEFIVTGGVPFKKNDELLATKMRYYLQGRLQNQAVHAAINCYNSSTDALAAMAIANGKYDRLIILSSTWHLSIAEPIWKYHNKKQGNPFELTFMPLPGYMDEAGKKTRFFYTKVMAPVVRATLATGTFPLYDAIVNRLNASRQDGFPVTGCD